MKIIRSLGKVVFIMTCIGLAQTAVSAPIVFTDRTDWEAAISGIISTETFDGVATQKLAAGTTTLGALDFEIDVADVGNYNTIRDQGGGDHEFNGRVSNGQTFAGGSVASYIDVIFGSMVNAFGADFTSTTTGAELKLSNGSTVVFSDHLTGVGTGFLGIVDADAFSEVSFTAVAPASSNVAEVFQMDDLSWASVPEPSTIALLALGLMGMGFSRRRQLRI